LYKKFGITAKREWLVPHQKDTLFSLQLIEIPIPQPRVPTPNYRTVYPAIDKKIVEVLQLG
jgi:hypothetical protein